MKELLRKEMTLAASPLSYLFVLFSLMTLIPGYPICVGAFFICLGIFYTFQAGRENNDTLFTALLPVEKKDVVKAKYAFVVFIELFAEFFIILLTILRMTVLKDSTPYVTNPLVNANLAYIGYTLMIFALFNSIFMNGFFKTAYYIGKPFIIFCIVGFVVVTISEVLHNIPGLQVLNTTSFSPITPQLYILAAGILLYILLSFLSLRKSINLFEKIDL